MLHVSLSLLLLQPVSKIPDLITKTSEVQLSDPLILRSEGGLD